MTDINIENLDLYALLEITINATTADIRSAYRKKALKCHPDKNPDDPKAAETFRQLTKALEVLLDESARAAYDKVLRGKEAARLRHQALDERRKKFKEDLEARERAATTGGYGGLSDSEKLRREVERLQKEGAHLVQEELRRLKEEILISSLKFDLEVRNEVYHVNVEWSEEGDNIYNKETLEMIFKKYGDVEGIAISGKKKGKAIVEFQNKQAAELAIMLEKGFAQNPLSVRWVDKSMAGNGKKLRNHPGSNLVNDRDFESLVVRNLRQAEERKRLIEQMEIDDLEC